MRHRFDRHHAVTLSRLSLIVASDERFKANRKIRCLHKCPGEILVPIFCVATAFAFAVGKLLAPHAPAVRSKVSHLRKSSDVSSLQHDRQRQGLPDAVHRDKIAISVSRLRITVRFALTASARLALENRASTFSLLSCLIRLALIDEPVLRE